MSSGVTGRRYARCASVVRTFRAQASSAPASVSVLFAGGLQIVGQDGADLGKLDVGAVNSNCTFDGNALYITDGGNELGTRGGLATVGMLWRVELDVPGMTLFRGSIS